MVAGGGRWLEVAVAGGGGGGDGGRRWPVTGGGGGGRWPVAVVAMVAGEEGRKGYIGNKWFVPPILMEQVCST